jgi:methylthioribose-1-phosphate isomerase
MNSQQDSIRAIIWQDQQLQLLDQRKLPHEQIYLSFDDAAEVAQAIRDMVVRGAPAIGIAAAYAVVLAAKTAYQQNPQRWHSLIQPALQQLALARPTAVNLMWALQRMESNFAHIGDDDPVPVLLAEAQQIHQEDIAANYTMGELGAALLPQNCCVLTHCNAGALATGGYGTALGVVRSGYAAGKVVHVYADETRPWWQGSRLTAWELMQENIPVTLIADSVAASLMQRGKIDWVIVGADRITANGDVANKIGTYSLAVLARHHGVKFMVVAPISTLDATLDSGDSIEIEQRPDTEVVSCHGQRIAANNVAVWNPVFDVTPAELVDFIVTEKGIIHQPTHDKLSLWF